MSFTGRTKNMDIWDDFYWSDDYIPESRSKNYNAPVGVHIMNKNESAALRKLKKETGLSEEEIRKEKKYRKILSEAQKEKGNKDDIDRMIIYIVKKITSETKLPVEHPRTKEKIKEYISSSKITWGRGFKPSLDKVISRYLSLRKKSKEKGKKKK